MIPGQPQVRARQAVDPFSKARLERALGACRIGRPLRIEASVGSTNDLARELGQEGAPNGAVVIADEQTSGRGRRQRVWSSPPGLGLYVSVLLRPAAPPVEAGPAVQLVAGIAVAESLSEVARQSLTLRWPNDCYHGTRKLAGVLVEAEATGGELDFIVCGIGINVNQDADQFPKHLRDRATSLRMLTGHRLARQDVLVRLLRSLQGWYEAWRGHGLEPVLERWLELSPGSRGDTVEVQTDRGLIRGISAGLSPTGSLQVDVGDRLCEITVGELVRVGPGRAAPRGRSR